MSYSDGQSLTERDVPPLTERDAMRLIKLGNQNQNEGNYQGATKKYLQALEVIAVATKVRTLP